MRVLCTIDEVVNTSMYSSESNLKITKEYSGADRNTVLFSPKVIYPVLIDNVLYGVRCFSTSPLWDSGLRFLYKLDSARVVCMSPKMTAITVTLSVPKWCCNIYRDDDNVWSFVPMYNQSRTYANINLSHFNKKKLYKNQFHGKNVAFYVELT